MKRLILWLLTRLWGSPEEVNGAGRCPTYLYRWHLASAFDCKLYIHRFVRDDWSTDRHDHPKRFISIGLWGSYLEHTPAGTQRFRAPWIRSFPAVHQHRLTLPWGECWTLVVVLRGEREWGFWHDGRFIQWWQYVRGDAAHLADKRKTCL